MKLLNILLIATIALLISCGGSKNENSNDSNENTGLTKQNDNTNEDNIEDEEETKEEAISINTDNENIIYLENQAWNKGSEEGIRVVKGINTALMSAVIFQYVEDKHIDKKRNEKGFTDSSFVKLSENKFSFYRKYNSGLTKYDYVKQEMENQNLYSSEEDLSDEEIEKLEQDRQKEIAAIDPNLKNIKIYDYYVVRGDWKFIKAEGDNLQIEISGEIADIDAMTYLTYGENGPIAFNPFKDTYNVDLPGAICVLGRLKKLSKEDLAVIDNENYKYIRNRFFAEKGFKFKTDAMNNYFGEKDWYTPEQNDVSNMLSDLEKNNITYIKELEN
ncbi:MAG: YARHG domain-containing protein [bacterium]|nr:YARHG domain-containing protein [bacterium]